MLRPQGGESIKKKIQLIILHSFNEWKVFVFT